MDEIDALHRARPIKSQNRHRSSKPSKFAWTSDFQVDEVIRESFPTTGIDHRVLPPLSLSRGGRVMMVEGPQSGGTLASQFRSLAWK